MSVIKVRSERAYRAACGGPLWPPCHDRHEPGLDEGEALQHRHDLAGTADYQQVTGPVVNGVDLTDPGQLPRRRPFGGSVRNDQITTWNDGITESGYDAGQVGGVRYEVQDRHKQDVYRPAEIQQLPDLRDC